MLLTPPHGCARACCVRELQRRKKSTTRSDLVLGSLVFLADCVGDLAFLDAKVDLLPIGQHHRTVAQHQLVCVCVNNERERERERERQKIEIYGRVARDRVGRWRNAAKMINLINWSC